MEGQVLSLSTMMVVDLFWQKCDCHERQHCSIIDLGHIRGAEHARQQSCRVADWHAKAVRR